MTAKERDAAMEKAMVQMSSRVRGFIQDALAEEDPSSSMSISNAERNVNGLAGRSARCSQSSNQRNGHPLETSSDKCSQIPQSGKPVSKPRPHSAHVTYKNSDYDRYARASHKTRPASAKSLRSKSPSPSRGATLPGGRVGKQSSIRPCSGKERHHCDVARATNSHNKICGVALGSGDQGDKFTKPGRKISDTGNEIACNDLGYNAVRKMC